MLRRGKGWGESGTQPEAGRFAENPAPENRMLLSRNLDKSGVVKRGNQQIPQTGEEGKEQGGTDTTLVAQLGGSGACGYLKAGTRLSRGSRLEDHLLKY